MDFSLTDDQKAYRDCIVTFARQKLGEGCAEDDRAAAFPRSKWSACAETGLTGLLLEEEFGGLGYDLLTSAVVLQGLGYACRDGGLVHALLSHVLAAHAIRLFGDEEQKRAYLPPMCKGERIGAQGITEPGAGSDATSMTTSARRDGEDYVLNGTKCFVSNGPIADCVIVFVVTDAGKSQFARLSAFIIDRGTPGFEQGPPLEKMGLRTLQNGELVFQDCRVPVSGRLGKEGQGSAILFELMEWERVLLFAPHLGVMENVLETAVQYAKEREQFGKPIAGFEAVSHKLADMKVNLELGTLALHKAAALKDAGKRAAMECAIAKLFVSESLKAACLDSAQIHGAYGYMAEYDIERQLRDSISSSVYSGTSEIQRNIIARLLGC